MTVLKALAIREAAVLECKNRDVNTPELRAALDFLEPHIEPAWLIPQLRAQRAKRHLCRARRTTTGALRHFRRYPRLSQGITR